MAVDLTKPAPPEPQPHPDDDQQPQPAPGPGPAQQPEPADKEPVALTAREELTLPLNAFRAAIVAGSPLLARWIGLTVWNGIREASSKQGSTQKKADSGQEGQAHPASKADEGGIGDLVEQLALGAFCVALACTALTGALSAAWPYIAPYAWWLVIAAVVGWCLAAVAFAPGEDADAPEDDHEELAGEQDEEDAEAERGEVAAEDDEEAKVARWIAEKESLRLCVEQQVAAGAAGHIKGVKGRGVRVDDLLAVQQHGALPGMQRKGMIERLEMAGIKVREQMKFRVLENTETGPQWRAKNVPGVHLEDVTEMLGRAPRLPAHLVPDRTPGAPRVLSPESGVESAPEPAQIPAARTPAE